MNQVYKLKGGFTFRKLSNSFTQTAGQMKGAIQSVCRPSMNSGETLYNNTLYNQTITKIYIFSQPKQQQQRQIMNIFMKYLENSFF